MICLRHEGLIYYAKVQDKNKAIITAMLLTLLHVRVSILLTCRKRLLIRIISQRTVHNTSLTRSFVIAVHALRVYITSYNTGEWTKVNNHIIWRMILVLPLLLYNSSIIFWNCSDHELFWPWTILCFSFYVWFVFPIENLI
jgi:hypothetical protein